MALLFVVCKKKQRKFLMQLHWDQKILILQSNKKKLIKFYVESYSQLSLRESGSINQLKKLANKEMRQNIDPVLLLKKEDWLKIATGEYICFADPDDYLMNDYVDYLLGLALQNNAGIALSKDMYSSFDKKETTDKIIEIETPEKITVDILMHKVPIGVYCKIFKKSLIDKFNIHFRKDIYIGEGFNFNTFAFQRANKIAVGYKRIYFYRTDNQNSAVSKFNEKKWENALYALDCIESDLTIKTKLICNAMNYAKWFDGYFILSQIARNNAFAKCKDLTNKCKCCVRKYFKYVFKTETSLKQKIKALMFYFTPIFCSKIFYGR